MGIVPACDINKKLKTSYLIDVLQWLMVSVIVVINNGKQKILKKI
jgi:hypothetical protein